MQALSRSTLQSPVSLLEKTPALLEILLRDLPPDVLQWQPAPQRWSIAEVVAHLVLIEQVYEGRARRIIMEDDPMLPKYVAPDESDPGTKSTAECLERFVTQRRAFAFFLHSVPASSGSRTGRHSELGSVTLSQMLNELANHDLGHLRQIAELYRACSFYPYVGPFRKYSSPKP